MVSILGITALKASDQQLTPKVVALVEVVGAGAVHFGAHLLSTRTDRDHEERLSAVLEDRVFRAWYNSLTTLIANAAPDVDAVASDLSGTTTTWTKRASMVFGASAPLANATIVLAARAARLVATVKPSNVEATPFPKFSWGMFYDPEVPGLVVGCLVEGLFAEIESMAIYVALERGRSLPPHTSERLLRSLSRHMQSALRLLTLVRALKVPVDMVPRKDRLDLTALQEAEHLARLRAASRTLADLGDLLQNPRRDLGRPSERERT